MSSWYSIGRIQLHFVGDFHVIFFNCKKCDSNAESTTFLWRIKRKPPAYFFGTIHVPYTKVWDYIPSKAIAAFSKSDRIMFELDMTNSSIVSAMSKCHLLPTQLELMDVIPKHLYKRLKKYLQYIRHKLPSWISDSQKFSGMYGDYLFNAITSNWEKKKPLWVMVMINSLTESEIKLRGSPFLDIYLAQEARRLNKQIGSIEMVREQCIALDSLNASQALFALNQTLIQHESIRKGNLKSSLNIEDLVDHYNCGDLSDTVFKHATQLPILENNTFIMQTEEFNMAKSIDDHFREEVFVKRNKRMVRRVADLLNANPEESFFFVIGAGEFKGFVCFTSV